MEAVQSETNIDRGNRNKLVEKNLKLVDFLVERMSPQVPFFLSRDDMASAGMRGLISAADRYDPYRGASFKTFAEPRVRGAMLDEVRKMDWFSRDMRDKQTRWSNTMQALERRLEREPREEEAAEAMDMTLENYRQLLGTVSHLGCVSLHEKIDGPSEGDTFLDLLRDKESLDPCENIECKELIKEVVFLLKKLSEKDRLVINMYYYEEMTQKEIADLLELSEGRISQLHRQALHKLKAKIKNNIPMD